MNPTKNKREEAAVPSEIAMSEVKVKKCTGICGEEKPDTLEFFYKKRNGLEKQCKACRLARCKERHANGETWEQKNPERKKSNRADRLAWNPERDHALGRLTGYYRKDKAKGFSLPTDREDPEPELGISYSDVLWIQEQPCTYCDYKDGNCGADRIDNSRGHASDNVVPACGVCNRMRGNCFSPQQMIRTYGPINRRQRAKGLISSRF